MSPAPAQGRHEVAADQPPQEPRHRGNGRERRQNMVPQQRQRAAVGLVERWQRRAEKLVEPQVPTAACATRRKPSRRYGRSPSRPGGAACRGCRRPGSGGHGCRSPRGKPRSRARAPRPLPSMPRAPRRYPPAPPARPAGSPAPSPPAGAGRTGHAGTPGARGAPAPPRRPARPSRRPRSRSAIQPSRTLSAPATAPTLDQPRRPVIRQPSPEPPVQGGTGRRRGTRL